MTKRIVVGVTGASGAIYTRRLLNLLSEQDVHIHLVMSANAMQVIPVELDPIDSVSDSTVPNEVFRYFHNDKIEVHSYRDFTASIASGSYKTDGMVVCPCSAGTLGRIANGISSFLLDRAADVHLKERRKLILVLRETPYSAIMIENMLTVTHAGGIILPASPGFYHKPGTVLDVVDSVVSRILDHLGLESNLNVRWDPEK